MDYPSTISTDLQGRTAGLGLSARIAAPAATVRTNEAGTVALESAEAAEDGSAPRLVIRGESLYKQIVTEGGESYAIVLVGNRPKLIELPQPLADGVATAALVDYLNASFPFQGRSVLSEFFNQLFGVVGRAFAPAVDRKRGFHGYKNSFSLGETNAIFAYGGNNETALVSFPGESCSQIPEWLTLIQFLHDQLGARITRLDCAVDDFEGCHTVDETVDKYRSGLLNAGGRKPKAKQSGNWIEPDGSGRTFYVGSRRNGKLYRAYEKGMQLGIPWHPWVRHEVEWHNRDREIPWQAVLEPGKYVAGAYPAALGWVSEEQARIRTLRHTAKIGYEALTHWHSVAYGKHIEVMLAVEGSAEKVVERLRRPGFPSRLDLPPLPGYGKVYPPCEH